MNATAVLDKATHTYTAGAQRIPLSVSQVLSLSGICPAYPDDPRVMAFVEHAGMLGQTVHDWCDYLDSGESDVSGLEGSEILPYVVAYQRFREECRPEWEGMEVSLWDEKLNCAGTLDRVGSMIHGKSRRPVIVDIKTPKSAAKHWQIQLSGYQHLANRVDCSLFVVHLAGDGRYKVRPYESDIPTFLGAVAVAQWKLR